MAVKTDACEWQSMLQVLHVYAGCWTELTQSFLRTRLSVAAVGKIESGDQG